MPEAEELWDNEKVSGMRKDWAIRTFGGGDQFGLVLGKRLSFNELPTETQRRLRADLPHWKESFEREGKVGSKVPDFSKKSSKKTVNSPNVIQYSGTPKLLAYGSVNVVEIGGKAYYSAGKDKYMRAEERDNLIEEGGSKVEEKKRRSETISTVRELEALQNEARKTGNTNKFIVLNSTDGDFHVHRMGCADIKRREIQKQGINGMWWSEATDVDTLVKDEIKDFEEGGFEKGDFDENSFNVYPCAREVPKKEVTQKSDEQLEKRLRELSDNKPSNITDVELDVGFATEEKLEEFKSIIVELKQRNRIPETPPKNKPTKKQKKAKSKTSGWSKLKEELPTSGAVRARLADGGHSDGYRKVLESLEKYWTKRGK